MAVLLAHATDMILEKSLAGERISPEEALALYREADFLKVAGAAHQIRERRTTPGVVMYTMFRVVNYTTFCNVDCSFCSFYEPMGSSRGETLSLAQIVAKMEEAVAVGANQMFLQGGVNPELGFDYYLDVLAAVKQRFGPSLHIRAFSPVELIGLESLTRLPLREVLRRLKSAGLDSVPGAGAEILTDRMRSIISPKKTPPSEWARVMQTCHEEGLPGSANIVIGSEELQTEVIEHLSLIRDIQDRTGGFLSFIPWTFQRQTKNFFVRTVPAAEFLKVLGICRLFLDNIAHIETSVMVLGQGVGSLALMSGADDISSVVIEENVLKSYGLKSEVKAREFISEAGFLPKRRDLLDRTTDELAGGVSQSGV